MKNVVQRLAKGFLIPLGLTAAAVADPGIHKKVLGSGSYDLRAISSGTTTLIISNDEIKGIMNLKGIFINGSRSLPRNLRKVSF